MFDTPSIGLPRDLLHKIWRKLEASRRELEEMATLGIQEDVYVRLTLDNFEASVFWYIVLFRPFYFERDPVMGSRKWSLYEMLQVPELSLKLKRTDLGVVWEPERNWLILYWEEALEGVLKDITKCPSWGKIVAEAEKRAKKKLDWTWWKKCAESHSHSIPPWQLRRLSIAQSVLWHRGKPTYTDITAFDMSGIDVPAIDAREHGVNAMLPVAHRARFAHHYVEEEDKRDYQKRIRQFELRKQEKSRPDWAFRERKRKGAQQARRAEKRAARDPNVTELGRCVGKLSTALGKGYKGRHLVEIRPKDVEVRFNFILEAYVNGLLLDKARWKVVQRMLNKMEDMLPQLPEDYHNGVEKWLLWSGVNPRNTNPIDAYLAWRRRDFELFEEISKALDSETVETIKRLR
jgi:hypothetical protein